MLEMLLLDIFVIFAVFWLITDPNKLKPVLRRSQKSPSVRRSQPGYSRTANRALAEMTAELMPPLPELRSPEKIADHPESEAFGSSSTPNSLPKKSGRNQSKQVTTRPVPGEAQWGSFSTK
jgi:hypothetical protein